MPVPLKSSVNEWRENVLNSWPVQGQPAPSTLQTPWLQRPAREPAVTNGEITASSLQWLNLKCLSRIKLPFSCLFFFQSIFKAVAKGLKVFTHLSASHLFSSASVCLFLEALKKKTMLFTNIKSVTYILSSLCYFKCGLPMTVQHARCCRLRWIGTWLLSDVKRGALNWNFTAIST